MLIFDETSKRIRCRQALEFDQNNINESTAPAAGRLRGAKHTGQFPCLSENSAFTRNRCLHPQG